MRAWQSPDVPSLEEFGPGPVVSLFDTATGRVQPTDPQGTARMYVCGITPYDATHMGHAATYIAFDLLNRAWRDAGSRFWNSGRRASSSSCMCPPAVIGGEAGPRAAA